MSKFVIVSDLPNTSEEVSGVKFKAGAGGKFFSEPVTQEVADRFALIAGFTVVKQAEGDKKPAAKGAEAKTADAPKGEGDK